MKEFYKKVLKMVKNNKIILVPFIIIFLIFVFILLITADLKVDPFSYDLF
jgi:hypothetical protein